MTLWFLTGPDCANKHLTSAYLVRRGRVVKDAESLRALVVVGRPRDVVFRATVSGDPNLSAAMWEWVGDQFSFCDIVVELNHPVVPAHLIQFGIYAHTEDKQN